MSFPLSIAVTHESNVNHVMHLSVEQNYLVENLERKKYQAKVNVGQKFIVKSQ